MKSKQISKTIEDTILKVLEKHSKPGGVLHKYPKSTKRAARKSVIRTIKRRTPDDLSLIHFYAVSLDCQIIAVTSFRKEYWTTNNFGLIAAAFKHLVIDCKTKGFDNYEIIPGESKGVIFFKDGSVLKYDTTGATPLITKTQVRPLSFVCNA